jgi:hypothetical protein
VVGCSKVIRLQGTVTLDALKRLIKTFPDDKVKQPVKLAHLTNERQGEKGKFSLDFWQTNLKQFKERERYTEAYHERRKKETSHFRAPEVTMLGEDPFEFTELHLPSFKPDMGLVNFVLS